MKVLLGRLIGSKILATIILPLLKKIVIRCVQKEGDKLQERCVAIAKEQGPEAVDKMVDEIQVHVIGKVKGSWIPDIIENKVIEIVRGQGDKYQELLKFYINEHGEQGIGMAFDRIQEILIEKIKAL